MSQEITQSPIQRVMSWVKDGNLKNTFPRDLEKERSLSPIFILTHFLQSPAYFIFVNKVFNNYGLFYLSTKDAFKQLKEMYYYSRYQSYGTKKNPKNTENKLIDILKNKYPFLKKEEVVMLVEFIDNSDDKDVIYEQFGIKNVKTKKTTAKEKKEIQKKIKDVVEKSDILDLI